MKLPYFAFWASDFYSKTMNLTDEEVGKYIRLLCNQWINGPLKKVPKELKFLFKKTPEGYINERLESEREYATKKHETLSKNGAKGASKRWQKDSPAISPPNSEAISPAIAPANSTHTHTHTHKEKRKGFTPPTLDEVKKYFSEKGYNEDSALKAFEFYDVANWVDSKGNKVKNWKQKMLSVWFKDEHKEKPELDEFSVFMKDLNLRIGSGYYTPEGGELTRKRWIAEFPEKVAKSNYK